MSPSVSPSALRRLGRFAYRRHWLVIGVWVAAIVAIGVIGAGVGTGYSQSFGDFDSEASRGGDLLSGAFGESGGGNEGSLVVVAPEGTTLTDPAIQPVLAQLFDDVRAIDDLGPVTVVDPYDTPQQVAPAGPLAGRLGYARVQLSDDADFAAGQDFAREMRTHFGPAEAAGVRIEVGGQIFADFKPPESESLGIGFAIVILVLAFGSVLAMGLPIGMALAGIVAGVSLIGLTSNFLPMPTFTTTIAVMIGLGVGIDYALFIVTRFREDLHKGMPGEEAAGHALDTAGRAVLFAGTTVVISVLGMLVMGLGFIRGLGIGAAIAVVSSLLASITLLPALLGLAGARLEVTLHRGLIAAGLIAAALVGGGLGVKPLFALAPLGLLVLVVGLVFPVLRTPLPPRAQKPTRETFWYRYSRWVQHHAWLSALGGLTVLVVIAVPVLGLRLGFSDEGNYPEGSDTREAYDLLAEGFGPGSNGPLVLVAEVPAEVTDAALAEITTAVQATEDVVFVTPAQLSPDGSVARWIVVPGTAPQASETSDLVRTLRSEVLPAASTGIGSQVLVAGFTAIGIDFSDYFAGRYILFFGVVLGLSFLLLMAVFRSILVPLKAVLVNLLSIGAAYGIVVAIFQWGWGASLLGLSSSGAPIEPFLPMMLFAIVFGLSMDYEVFLLSRIKEEYDRTGDNHSAVADGLAVTARVITAAALIMVVVFGSFLLEHDRTVKLFGTGLAVAVLLDATIVRMLLVPATMELLGDKNWWLPKWLDRILPVIHVEGGPEDLGSDDDEDLADDDADRELANA